MSSPSNTQLDSSTPDASTPSTSGQSTMESPPADIEHDPNSSQPEISSTSGQPTTQSPPSSIENDPNNPPLESSTPEQPSIRPPPSSIEHDPDNPPPETQPSQQEQEQVSVGKELTFCQRIKIQLPLWKDYFRYFWPEVGLSTIFAMLAVVLCIAGYCQMENARVYIGTACVSSLFCFCIVWFWTESGPPFISGKDGNEIKPVYLRRHEVSASDRDLLTRSERKRIRREQF